MLRAAAIALVQADDVKAAREGFCGDAFHVVRVARGVQTVEDEDRRPFPPARLPVALREDARISLDVEVASHRRGQGREIPRTAPAVKSHSMAIRERWPGHEWCHHLDRIARKGRNHQSR